LEELRSLYLEQQDYLRAFELKQERRSIEHKNMDFVPSSALPPCSPWLGKVRQFAIRLWNRCAGRLPDVNRLIERLSRNDHKLTIIHGSSGVGKTSLIMPV
jgi:hypothetical protein